MNINGSIDEIKFNDKGLVPVIAQDINTKEVLMLAYMNDEAITKTLEQEIVHYYSRSRQELWKKGETSGNIQKLKGFYYDCDKDTILIKVEQTGVACHTGEYSCFFNKVMKIEKERKKEDVLEELYLLIKDRKLNPIKDSYTCYLFEKGLDKILKKVGEETSEVIIGAKNKDKEELVYEISDLVYHLLVLMANECIEVEEIKTELNKRKK